MPAYKTKAPLRRTDKLKLKKSKEFIPESLVLSVILTSTLQVKKRCFLTLLTPRGGAMDGDRLNQHGRFLRSLDQPEHLCEAQTASHRQSQANGVQGILYCAERLFLNSTPREAPPTTCWLQASLQNPSTFATRRQAQSQEVYEIRKFASFRRWRAILARMNR